MTDVFIFYTAANTFFLPYILLSWLNDGFLRAYLLEYFKLDEPMQELTFFRQILASYTLMIIELLTGNS